MMSNAFTLQELDGHLGLLTLDVPGERMNTLNAAVIPEFDALLAQLAARTDLKGLIIASGKPDNFIAGADIQMLDSCRTAEEAADLARTGQRLFERLEALPFPVIAAIHGPCLGGGLELALACRLRVCSDDDKTRLGLPEIQLGLLPGSGGTQRLPRLIGLPPALDLMLTGRRLRPKQAYRLGLVDAVVPESILLEAAARLLQQQPLPRHRLGWRQKALLLLPPLRNLVFGQARKQALAGSKGHYPAPLQVLEAAETGLKNGMQAGLDTEASRFGDLMMSAESAALRSLFLAGTALKKEVRYQGAEPLPLGRIGVLGAGLMGSGIAHVTACQAGLPVRIKDTVLDSVARAIGHSYSLLEERLVRRQLTPEALREQMARFSGGCDYRGFGGVTLVVEAVFEDLALKQQMVAELEQLGRPILFASNTSSLPIARIAAQAAHGERIVGLHYFSPVEKMPLVEVIPHGGTAPETVATALALARAQGKTPVVVKDVPGFYVNRILAPYLNEAVRILLEGEPVEAIDQALVDFGFPVGPLALLDEVGLDVAAKIGPVLELAYGERFTAPDTLQRLLAEEHKGRKSGRGFYRYGRRRKAVDPHVYALLKLKPRPQQAPAEIAERCVLLMYNEAMRCLDEGVITSARDGDLGAVYGIGFPPFLGGPFRAMAQQGSEQLIERLNHYAERYGERFQPCEALLARRQAGAGPA